MSTLNVSNITDGTTTVGTEYVVNGSAKAWVMHNASTVAQDSLNVSSLTDSGTGKTAVNFTNSFGAIDYAASICSMRGSGSNSHYENNGVSRSASALHAVYIAGTSAADTNVASVICLGDLA